MGVYLQSQLLAGVACYLLAVYDYCICRVFVREGEKVMDCLLGFLVGLFPLLFGLVLGGQFTLFRLEKSGYKFKYNNDTKKWELVNEDCVGALKDYSFEELHNECCERRYMCRLRIKINSYELAEKLKEAQKLIGNLIGKSVRVKWNDPPEEEWNKETIDDIGIVNRAFIQKRVIFEDKMQESIICFGVKFDGYSRVLPVSNCEFIE